MLTIITISRTKTLHMNANMFIVSTALIYEFMALAWTSHACLQFSWLPVYHRRIPDTILFAVSYATVLVSCIHMAIIATDCYIHIVHPFYSIKNMTKGCIRKLLLCAWILWLIYLLIPPTVYIHEKYHQKCIILQPPLEYFLCAATMILLCYIMVFVCYFKIVKVAFIHKTVRNARRLCNINSETALRIKNNRNAAMR